MNNRWENMDWQTFWFVVPAIAFYIFIMVVTYYLLFVYGNEDEKKDA
ncbi:TPA: hypothetical protein QCU60_004334 [Bacillus cereus]|nr:hypothetical protein [Bacillus cereus]HDR6312348.1 hypothetical protein [Bacillus cereus]